MENLTLVKDEVGNQNKKDIKGEAYEKAGLSFSDENRSSIVALKASLETKIKLFKKITPLLKASFNEKLYFNTNNKEKTYCSNPIFYLFAISLCEDIEINNKTVLKDEFCKKQKEIFLKLTDKSIFTDFNDFQNNLKSFSNICGKSNSDMKIYSMLNGSKDRNFKSTSKDDNIDKMINLYKSGLFSIYPFNSFQKIDGYILKSFLNGWLSELSSFVAKKSEWNKKKNKDKDDYEILEKSVIKKFDKEFSKILEFIEIWIKYTSDEYDKSLSGFFSKCEKIKEEIEKGLDIDLPYQKNIIEFISNNKEFVINTLLDDSVKKYLISQANYRRLYNDKVSVNLPVLSVEDSLYRFLSRNQFYIDSNQNYLKFKIEDEKYKIIIEKEELEFKILDSAYFSNLLIKNSGDNSWSLDFIRCSNKNRAKEKRGTEFICKFNQQKFFIKCNKKNQKINIDMLINKPHLFDLRLNIPCTGIKEKNHINTLSKEDKDNIKFLFGEGLPYKGKSSKNSITERIEKFNKMNVFKAISVDLGLNPLASMTLWEINPKGKTKQFNGCNFNFKPIKEKIEIKKENELFAVENNISSNISNLEFQTKLEGINSLIYDFKKLIQLYRNLNNKIIKTEEVLKKYKEIIIKYFTSENEFLKNYNELPKNVFNWKDKSTKNYILRKLLKNINKEMNESRAIQKMLVNHNAFSWMEAIKEYCGLMSSYYNLGKDSDKKTDANRWEFIKKDWLKYRANFSDYLTSKIANLIVKEAVKNDVELIIIERLDLFKPNRYLRTKEENNLLSAWSKGKIKDKLESSATLYGIKVVETNPKNTSQIDNKTGMFGYRDVDNDKSDLYVERNGKVEIIDSDANAANNIGYKYFTKEKDVYCIFDGKHYELGDNQYYIVNIRDIKSAMLKGAVYNIHNTQEIIFKKTNDFWIDITNKEKLEIKKLKSIKGKLSLYKRGDKWFEKEKHLEILKSLKEKYSSMSS